MRTGSSTIICVIGIEALAQLQNAANVARAAVERPAEMTPADAVGFARRVASATEGFSTTYVVTDADPLEPLRDAWIGRFSHTGDDLEAFIGVLRGVEIDLPDYYLVVGEQEHLVLEWYAGFMKSIRAERVVVEPKSDGAMHALRTLRSGPWWPRLADFVDACRIWIPGAQLTGKQPSPAGRQATSSRDR